MKKLLFIPLTLCGCIKTFAVKPTSFESYSADMNIQPSQKNGDYINIKITNKASENVYIDWTTAQVKIGYDARMVSTVVQSKLSGKPVTTITELAMISPNQSGVYNIYPKSPTYPSYSDKTSGHLFSVPSVSTSATGSIPLILTVNICSGPLNNGELPVHCQVATSEWNTATFKSTVQVNDL